jgi:hypothetical protein
MALSISWAISAPAMDRAEIHNRIADLHRTAKTLPFTAVDDVQDGQERIGFIAHGPSGSESTSIWLQQTGGAWAGHGSTKTLHAGKPQHGGDENFLVAHLSVTALLDAAARLGFQLAVTDGGGFWQHRDIRRLLQEQERNAQYVAGVVEQVAEEIRQQRGMDDDAIGEQDLDRWRQNTALDKLLDLVIHMRR